ncbi:MAG: hypothetical protein C0619_12000 [Desulfuromonas sp.]|nr:MAG: hypothetical protein C0619_12000 [Desulfuromonas sp.]
MVSFHAYLKTLLSGSIISLFLVTLTLGTDACALDKRTFIHIVPPKTNALHLVLVDTEMTTRQYLPNGNLQSQVDNDNLAIRTVARFSIADNLELALEVPYLLSREQERTNPAGVTQTQFDSEGFSDAGIQLTWQARDSRKGGFGLITGVELKAPTGNNDRGLGSETWDVSLRSVLSRKTAWGFPYLMAIYTDTGSTRSDGLKVDPANDLYLGLGFKSRFWNNVGFDLILYRYISTSRQYNASNGSQAIIEQHDMPGYKVYGRYRISKNLEWNIFYENSDPEDHQMLVNNMVIDRRPGDKKRVGTLLKYFW